MAGQQGQGTSKAAAAAARGGGAMRQDLKEKQLMHLDVLVSFLN
jgi:hypothetical protein